MDGCIKSNIDDGKTQQQAEDVCNSLAEGNGTRSAYTKSASTTPAWAYTTGLVDYGNLEYERQQCQKQQ